MQINMKFYRNTGDNNEKNINSAYGNAHCIMSKE